MDRRIVQKEKLFSMESRFADIPEWWLKHVEPKVMRGGFLPCWIWTGYLDANGYGVMRNPGGDPRSHVLAHRWVAEQIWDFDRRLVVTHTCHTRNCVNPAHFLILRRTEVGQP